MDKSKSFKFGVYFANALLAIAIVICDVFYTIPKFNNLTLKSITSAMFVLMGIINFAFIFLNKGKDLRFPAIMLTGLVFAMLGDIILEVEFIVGAALFAIGHIFFFVAYCFQLKFKWIDLVYGAVIFTPSVLLITLAPFFDFGGVLMEVVCIVYAAIISCMVGKAISNLIREHSITNFAILCGSVLFFISDLMLLLSIFGGLPVVGMVCTATYYPAEILLAISVLFAKSKQIKEENKKQD